MQRHRPWIIAKRCKDEMCSGTTASTATPPGDDPDMQSTVVVPNGISTHPSPMGGTLGTPMSCDTDCMRAVDSCERTREPDGDTPPASWVHPKARRSAMVPIGVAPAGAQAVSYTHLR